MPPFDVLVVGGGPAGMMAADTAASLGKRVLLLERNPILGRKLLLTGKGRCNVTNDCDRETLLEHVVRNAPFLYGAFARFDAQDTMHYFTAFGVPLVTERGNRVFPKSNRAADLRDCFRRNLEAVGVDRQQHRVTSLLLEPTIAGVTEGTANAAPHRVIGVACEDGTEFFAASVILATGGASYPLTGSTGDGYRLAAQAGHTVVAPRPSLIPLVTQEAWCTRLAGLSLKNVGLSLVDLRRADTPSVVFSQRGELLFTHFGVSGPLVLRASAALSREKMVPGRFRLQLDLKPALTEAQLDQRLLREFQGNQNRSFQNSLGGLLPKSMIPEIVQLSGIDPHKKVHTLTKQERRTLLLLLKSLPMTVQATRPIAEAIITAGGVDVSEVSPKTMGSKRVSGLYFCGELLDLDAYTGGYNLQIAFSTGYVAGMSC